MLIPSWWMPQRAGHCQCRVSSLEFDSLLAPGQSENEILVPLKSIAKTFIDFTGARISPWVDILGTFDFSAVFKAGLEQRKYVMLAEGVSWGKKTFLYHLIGYNWLLGSTWLEMYQHAHWIKCKKERTPAHTYVVYICTEELTPSHVILSGGFQNPHRTTDSLKVVLTQK